MRLLASTSLGLSALLALSTSLAACSSRSDKPAPGPTAPTKTEAAVATTIDAAPPPPLSRDAKCKAGEVAACDSILEHWSQRQIATPENVTAGKVDAAALQVACDTKISSACMALAMMYKYGTATGSSDKATSKKFWGRVAEYGDLNGFRGAEASELGAKALAETQKQCEDGRSRACNQAGWAAFGAVQQDKNVKAAQEFYSKGCALESGQGCHYAGHFAYVYPEETGAGASAETLLRKGCTLESLGACDELGLLLSKNGKAAEAKPLFESACAAGARSACMHLALNLADSGSGAEIVAPLLQKACDAGEKKACKALQDKGP